MQDDVLKLLTTTPPSFSETEAVKVTADRFGIRASCRQLVSERDQNFFLQANDGKRYVLKISNPAEQLNIIDFQNRALLHVARKDPSIPIPRVIAGSDGSFHVCVNHGGKPHFVRMLSWLEGRLQEREKPASALIYMLGQMLARLGLAFEGFDHPGSNPPLLWDMKRAGDLRELLRYIEQPELRQLIGGSLERFDTHVKPTLHRLRSQVIHNDLNPGNVLLDATASGKISGIIDFGDLVKSPLIIDLAVAAAYQLAQGDDPLAGALPMIAGYHSKRPLQKMEMELLPDLIRTRLITTLLIQSCRTALFPENREYLMTSFDSAKDALAKLDQLPANDSLNRITSACMEMHPAP